MLRYAGDRFVGTSSDIKPQNVLDGAVFFETDTFKIYLKISGSWVEVGSGGGGGGSSDVGRLFFTRTLPSPGQYVEVGYFTRNYMVGQLEVAVPAFQLTRVYPLAVGGSFSWREVVPSFDYRMGTGDLALDVSGNDSNVYLRFRTVAGTGGTTAFLVLSFDDSANFVPTDGTGSATSPGFWHDARNDAQPVPATYVYGSVGMLEEISLADGRRQIPVYEGSLVKEIRFYRGSVFLYKYVYSYDSMGNVQETVYSTEE